MNYERNMTIVLNVFRNDKFLRIGIVLLGVRVEDFVKAIFCRWTYCQHSADTSVSYDAVIQLVDGLIQ